MKTAREALLRALKITKSGLSSGGAIPALSHFWFDKKTVSAYDGGLGVSLEYNSELDCGVPGSVLLGLLNSSVTKEVEVKYIGDKLDVKLGRSSMQLAALEGDQRVWPFPDKPKTVAELELTEELLAALKKALIVRASKPTQVAHHGVMCVGGKGCLDLYTTDGSTLARVTVEAKVPAKFPRVILPTPFVDAVLAHVEKGATLYINNDHLSVEGKEIVVACNLLDTSTAADLPKVVDRLLPAKDNAVPLPQGLETALERATILASGSEPFVDISAEEDEFLVDAKYPLGKLAEKLKLEKSVKDGGEGRVLAGEVLKVLPHATSFEFTSNVVVFSQGEDFLYLVTLREVAKG